MKTVLFSFFLFFTFLYSQTSQAQKQRDHYELLWKISGNGLKKPSYLFGTMHLTDDRVFDFSDSVIAKIQECEGFALEIAPDSISQFIAQALLDKSKDENDTIQHDLKNDLTVSEYVVLKEKLLKEAGLNLDEVKHKSPSQIADLLNSPTLYSNDKTTFLDGYLYRIALGEKKAMHGLEEVSDNTYESTSQYEKGLEELREIIHASAYKASADQLIQLYYEGDIEKINEYVSQKDANELKVLAQRNINMADRIHQISPKQTVFYAVGAAHLAGDEGIISLLRKKGYTVTKVSATFTGQAAKYKPKAIDASWQRYSFAEEGYSLSMPGKPVLYPLKEEMPLTMHAFPDLATGIFYFSLSIKLPSAKSDIKIDEVMDAFVSNMFKTKGSAKGFKKKSLKFKEAEASEGEFYNQKDKMYGRVRILKNNGYVYFLMVCSYKKESLNISDSYTFFDSMEFIKPAGADAKKNKDKWKEYSSEQGAFKVESPVKMTTFMKEVASESGDVNAYFLSGETFDDVAYLVVYYLPPAGLVVYDDSTYLNGFTERLTANTPPEIAQVKSTTFKGYPARTCFKQEKPSDFLMEILLVLRGSRVYMVFVVAEKEKMEKADTKRFFESMEFLPYKKSKWFAYEDQEEGLKWKVPGEVQKEVDTSYSVELPFEKTYSAIDTCSGTSYVVNVSTYSPYYYMPQEDFIKNQKKDYVAETDSILVEKKRTVNGIQGIEMIIQSKETRTQKRVFLMPLNNNVIQLYSCSLPELIQSDVVNDFFSSLTLTNAKPNTTLFDSKAQQLLKNLASDDSTTAADALSMLDYYKFQSSETKMVYAELKKKWKDDSSGYQSVRAVLLSRLPDLEDATTISFIQELYPALKPYPTLQVKALETLLHLKSAASKDLLVKLINEDVPSVEEIPYMFFGSMNDSLELNQTWYPEMFTFVKNKAFRSGIYDLGSKLLDSLSIRKDFFVPHLEQLLAFSKEDLEEAENYNAPYMNVWYGITLLGHFTEHKEVVDYLTWMSHHTDDLLAFDALTELINHKLTVDPVILSHFAAQNQYRIRLHTLLKDADQLNLFPAKWKKQEYFAEANLYNYLGGYEDEFYYEKIELINSKVIHYKGVSSRFYLFKLLYDNEWYVGISGPFAVDKKQYYSEDTSATYSTEETLKSKSIKQHYEDLLKDQPELY